MSILENRLSKYESINIDKWECKQMIGSNSKFGEVWSVETTDAKFAIKKIPMTKYDIKIGLRKCTPSEFLTMKRSVWVELFFLRKCEDLVKKKICPGFILIYFNSIVQNTIFRNPKLSSLNGSNSMTIAMELAKTDLQNYSKNKLDTIEWVGIIFQILFIILTYQKHLKISHNDLHWGNILIYDIKSREDLGDQQYILYEYKKTKFYVPFFGYIIIIIDFGFVSRLNNENIMKDVKRISHLNKWIREFYKMEDVFLRTFQEKVNICGSIWDLIKDLSKILPKEVKEEVIYDKFLIDKSI